MRCSKCGDDIDAKGQDNVSYISGYPLCEDCAGGNTDSNYEDQERSITP